MTSITFFLIFIPVLTVLLLAINLLFAPHNSYEEKNSTFECGFHSFLGQNRTQFSISFFIFALLFLLFDLEILLVYPYVVSSYGNGIYGLAVMLIFFLVLTLGFAFELGKDALHIDSKQMFIVKSKSSIPDQSYNDSILLKSSTLGMLDFPVELLGFLIKLLITFIVLLVIALVGYISQRPASKLENEGSYEVQKRRVDRRNRFEQEEKDWLKDHDEILRKLSQQYAHNIVEKTDKCIYDSSYPIIMQLTVAQFKWLHEYLPANYPNKYYYNGTKIVIPNFKYNEEKEVISNPAPVRPILELIWDVGKNP